MFFFFFFFFFLKLSLIIFSFNVYFKLAAFIGSHFEKIISQYLKNLRKNLIFMQFASKFAVFQILLNRINLDFLFLCDRRN